MSILSVLILGLLTGNLLAAPFEGIAYPRLLESRASTGEKVVQLNDELTLSLSPSDVLASSIFYRTYENGHQVDTWLNTAEIQSKLYEDVTNMASVMLSESQGALQVEGVLGSKLRISPLPDMARSNDGRVAHRIYEVTERMSTVNDGVLADNITILDYQVQEIQERQSSVIRPEVVLISDSVHNSAFSSDQELINYLAVLMNAVNLRYANLNSPQFKLLIVGVVRSTASKESYVKMYSNYMLGNPTLTAFRDYIEKNPPASSFDLVYLITGRDMASDDNNKLEPGLAGLAYVGGTCTSSRQGEGEDKAGSYDGVHTAAHELAHLLGCVHDGDPAPSYLPGSPGATACPWSEGYIMSYIHGGLKHFQFSPCCVAQMRYLVGRSEQKCLQSVSAKPVNTGSTLPGEVISTKKYCELAHPDINGVWADDAELEKCKVRCCTKKDRQGSYTYYSHDALDGTQCQPGKKCTHGKCS